MNNIKAQFLYQTAPRIGLTDAQARTILRAAQTLHTWAVHECNGTKQREQTQDADGYWNDTGVVNWYNPDTGKMLGRTPDLEAGALKRVQAVCKDAGIAFEHQGDPRGYVLKLVKDGREIGVPSGD